MKCPACGNELSEIQVGKLKVDVCQGGCGGIWFDAFELKRLDEQHEPGEPLQRVQIDPAVVVDQARKRECPRCLGIKLLKHFYSPRRKVQVDECPNCGGYWLDAGELAQIRAENTEGTALGQAHETTISAEFIRYLYRLDQSH